MRSFTDYGTRCDTCLIRRDLCLCAEVPTVRTRTRIVIVRHYLEGKRSTNTARIARLALPDAELLEYGTVERPFNFAELGTVDPWMLFPDGATTAAEPPRTLVVIDATWSQARRMVQRVPAFRSMPRLRLDAAEAMPRIRTAPRADGMSTLEAMSRALAMLEGEAVAGPLERLCRLHVARSRMAKGLPAEEAPTPAR